MYICDIEYEMECGLVGCDVVICTTNQVNEDQSLHQDADPRYRGSHIPSRAFRMLQNFTADTDTPDGINQI